MLKRFLAYYRPHKLLFGLDMGASLLVSVIAVIYPMITRWMLNDLIPNRQLRMVAAAGALLLGLYFVRMLLNYFIQYQGHMMGTKMQAQMRRDLFSHLEQLPFRFFDDHETGKIMSRLTNDLFEVSELAHHGPENILICTFSVALSFVYLATIDLWLTLIIFACVPLLVVCSLYTRKKMRSAFRRNREANARINADLQSSVSGIRITKAFTNADKEQEKFEVGNLEFQESKREAYRSMAQFQSSTTFITDVFNVVVLVAGGVFLYRGSIDFADYSAFIVSINLFLQPVKNLINFMEQYQNGVAGFERFLEVMDQPPEEDDPAAVAVDRLEGHIQFRDVCYGYEEDHEVLQHINLDIPAGKTFALVGPSGGGKTTICHLIPHFYEIQSGQITVDGRPLDTITRDSLRRNIGIVQQDIYLFNASIRDNILYGRLDATQAEVEEAAKRANIHDYIMSLEEGYDTVIGERGVRLSGGQKQRLCIARALLKKPKVLILDDSTSAVDTATDAKIRAAFAQKIPGTTKIIIAQRISSVESADRILVLDNGRIDAFDTHENLLKTNAIYQEIYESQVKGGGDFDQPA